MDFLKTALSEELFNQLTQAINAHNGNEANKDSQIKLANLASGEYVGKGKYEALNELLKGKDTELVTANGLIADLKKGAKGNEEMQGKITQYESTVAELQAQLQETKLKAEIKVQLLAAGVKDEKVMKFLTFELMEELKEKGETLELDEAENIKGWEDKLSGLKTQFPTMFEAQSGSNHKILENKLPEGDKNGTVTKEQFLKMGVEERSKFKANNEALYKQYAGKE